MKPGKPTTFATCQYKSKKKYFLCLPGNPVSAIITAYLFVLRLLNRLNGNHSKPIVVKSKVLMLLKVDKLIIIIIIIRNGIENWRPHRPGHRPSQSATLLI